jgi:nucleoid DNA-binding protein
MKITKARLLHIIREEVELHEKYVEENVLELDEEVLEELTKEQGRNELEKAIQGDKIARREEDKLLDPKTKKPVNGTKANDI